MWSRSITNASVAARQVQVVHQAVARIVLAVAPVIYARTPIIAFAPVIPSGIVHSPSCVMHRFESVKAPRQELRRAIQASPWKAGSKTAASKAWS
jgi:hypothetical protein